MTLINSASKDEKNSIKEAFEKVKLDINFLNEEILSIKVKLDLVMTTLNTLSNKLSTSTNPITVQKTSDIPTDLFKENYSIQGLKEQHLPISIRNEGVPTDSQTDQQTDRQTDKSLDKNIQEASAILNSLDRLKKEIRLKFKRITNQEMVVFSTIYQLEEQDPDNITYKKVADNLKLSESSIRDYVQRIINKGIPLKKQKINNKKILLSVSQDLKKIATLSTIIKLREL